MASRIVGRTVGVLAPRARATGQVTALATRGTVVSDIIRKYRNQKLHKQLISNWYKY